MFVLLCGRAATPPRSLPLSSDHSRRAHVVRSPSALPAPPHSDHSRHAHPCCAAPQAYAHALSGVCEQMKRVVKDTKDRLQRDLFGAVTLGSTTVTGTFQQLVVDVLRLSEREVHWREQASQDERALRHDLERHIELYAHDCPRERELLEERLREKKAVITKRQQSTSETCTVLGKLADTIATTCAHPIRKQMCAFLGSTLHAAQVRGAAWWRRRRWRLWACVAAGPGRVSQQCCLLVLLGDAGGFGNLARVRADPAKHASPPGAVVAF